MISLSTVKLLREWAKWGEAHNLDYPKMSPMFGERALKAPLYGIGHIPPDVMKVERAVCCLSPDDRDVIIYRYQWHMSFPQMGIRIGRTRWVAQRRLQRAEQAVHNEFVKSSTCSPAPTHARKAHGGYLPLRKPL